MNLKFLVLRALKRFYPRRQASGGTVHFMYPVVLLGLLTGLTATSILSQPISYIKLTTSQQVVSTGDEFSVVVSAFAHVPVNAVDITLAFDQTKVDVLGIDRGQSVITLWTSEPEVKNGAIRLQGGTYRRGFRDEHQIAIINFKARKPGLANFLTDQTVFLAGDGAATEVTVTDSNISNTSVLVKAFNEDTGQIETVVEMAIVTDLNGDGVLTLADISIFMSSWHRKDVIYDFTGDGRMTFRDFSVLLANYFFGQ